MADRTSPSTGLLRQLSRLWQLDRDAEAAYAAAAGRVRRPALRRGLRALAADCRRHVDELAPYLPAAATSAGPSDDERRLLRAGRLMLAQVLGDAAVLGALADLVREGNAAYADVLADGHLGTRARAVVQRNACDERRHEDWLRGALRRPTPGGAAAADTAASPSSPADAPAAWDDAAACAAGIDDDAQLAAREPPPAD